MTKGTILSVSLIAVAMLATPVAARERHGSARNYAVESDVTTAPGQVYLGAQSCNPGPRVGAFASAPWDNLPSCNSGYAALSGLSGVGILTGTHWHRCSSREVNHRSAAPARRTLGHVPESLGHWRRADRRVRLNRVPSATMACNWVAARPDLA